MIELADWVALIPPEDKCLAYIGEHETVRRQFFLPDVSYREYSFYVDMAFDLSTVTTVGAPVDIVDTNEMVNNQLTLNGDLLQKVTSTNKKSFVEETVTIDCQAPTDVAPLSKLVRDDGIVLTWTVLAQHTQLPGLLRATLRAVGPNGEVKKSALMVFYVEPAVSASPAATIPLTEYEQMERAMVLALEQASRETLNVLETRVDGLLETVEHIYDPTSTNPQSGIAVAQAIEEARPQTAATDAPGLVQVPPDGGIDVDAYGALSLAIATRTDVDDRMQRDVAKALTPSMVDYAVKQGLCNTAIAWDDDEKAQARTLLGIGSFENIVELQYDPTSINAQSGQAVSQAVTQLESYVDIAVNAILERMHPVGSVYISYSHDDPGLLFAGTWERITNAFLWATDENGIIGETGGESEHLLTVAEIPAHRHDWKGAMSKREGTLDNSLVLAAFSDNDCSSLVTNGRGPQYEGGGQSHNNMPPYINVSVWRRIA